jgi:hypothetical protein
VRGIAVAILLAGTLPAQQPDTSDLLDALARSAAIFARSVPGLTARETLHQRGRRGSMQILKKGRHEHLKNVAFTIPQEFQTHEVVSEYSFGVAGDASGFHEIRKVLTVDTIPVTPDKSRHTLTLDSNSPDDETKKSLLEDLEHTQLQGSVVDFGPMLLLFTKQKQADFEFRSAGHKAGVFVLNYRQISGPTSVTEFRERTEMKHPLSGQIWLRETDLVPTRITVTTEEVLTTKYTLSNEAEIDYQPTPYGLAPSTVVHRQYLNQDLLVENQFRYTDYHGRTFIP